MPGGGARVQNLGHFESVLFTYVSATIRGNFLFHLFSEFFCQSCTLGFVPLFPKSVGHTVSENIYLFIILCHRILLYPKHYFIFKNHENLRKGSYFFNLGIGFGRNII